MQRALKRLFDACVALVLLIVLAPLLVLLAILVRTADGTPVLYRQRRLGKHGAPFELLKFRSMRSGNGASVAPVGDARITAVGRVLRRTRLDELPQLFSVLAGTMSLVGPRPLPPGHAATLAPGQLDELLSVPPGITGASALAFLGDDAALGGRDDAQAIYLERVLPAKVSLDLDYLRDWRPRTDVRLLLATAYRLCSPAARRDSRAMVERLLERH